VVVQGVGYPVAADWDLQGHRVRWDCREFRGQLVPKVIPVSQAFQDYLVRSDCQDHRDYLVLPAPRAIRVNRDQLVFLGRKA
jgi:hypothetical protein